MFGGRVTISYQLINHLAYEGPFFILQGFIDIGATKAISCPQKVNDRSVSSESFCIRLAFHSWAVSN